MLVLTRELLSQYLESVQMFRASKLNHFCERLIITFSSNRILTQILIVVSSWKLNSSIQWKKMTFFRLSWQKNFSLQVSNRILFWVCWCYRAAALITRSRVVESATAQFIFLACNLIAYFTFTFVFWGRLLIKQFYHSRLLTHLVGYLPVHIQLNAR